MITESVIEKLNDDGSVVVKCPTESCDACKVKLFCSSKKQTEFTVLNTNNLALSSGDKVELYLNPKRTILSLFMIFGLPLMLFVLVYMVLRRISSLSEVVSGLISLLSMSLSFLLVYMVTKRNKKTLTPIIERIIHE